MASVSYISVETMDSTVAYAPNGLYTHGRGGGMVQVEIDTTVRATWLDRLCFAFHVSCFMFFAVFIDVCLGKDRTSVALWE